MARKCRPKSGDEVSGDSFRLSSPPSNMKGKISMDLHSLGHAAGMYQRHPKIIAIGLLAVKAKAEVSLNGVQYFRAEYIADAITFLVKQESEKKPQVPTHPVSKSPHKSA